MKKSLLFTILLLCLFFSCSNVEGSFIPLKVDYPTEENKKVEMQKDEVINFNMFAWECFNNLGSSDENVIFSPASLYMALAMEAEGAKENTLVELQKILRFDEFSKLRSTNKALFETNYYNNKEGKAKIANSYWVNSNLIVKEQYQKILVDNYYAEANIGNFDNTMLRKVARWINDNTYNFLNVKENDLLEILESDYALINTIYFQNKWEVSFKKENTKTEYFYPYASKEVSVDMMSHTIYSTYAEEEKFELVEDHFYNGNTITYILPKEGYSVNDLNYDFENIQKTKSRIFLSVPKFKYTNKHNLVPVLKQMGVNDLFDPVKCDLSNISDTKLYCNLIKQIAGVELTEEGVKAAAVTIVGDKATSCEPEIFKIIKLDRPFIYYIKDANDCILFMGVMYNPNL